MSTDQTPQTEGRQIGRRQVLLGREATPTTFVATDFDGVGTCQLVAETTAGPFPLDEQFNRRDITEGYPGHPVKLGIRVVDEDCAPMTDVTVEVWLTDASGDYSAFEDGGTGKDEGPGTTFQRGTQPTHGEGIVEFLTLYPGHYPGRPPHIHIRIHRDGDIIRTSQLFFDDDYSLGVYSTGAYEEFGTDFTRNADDSIAQDAIQGGSMVTIEAGETALGAGSVAVINVGV